MANCENIITSDNYIDALLKYRPNAANASLTQNLDCVQIINDQWIVLHNPIAVSPQLSTSTYGYASIPKLFGLMDTTGLDASGVTSLHNQPILNLSGKGIIVGIIDTGIDYTHEAFINSDNMSKILTIWDQTIYSGSPPVGFKFGTEYTTSQINEALQSTSPYDIVPTTDTNGHGTFIAAVAAGYKKSEADFIGVAYNAKLAVVKLKPAKQYLRDYYLIKENVLAFQENDIMLALKYLRNISIQYQMPLAICLSIGNSNNGHIGESPLGDYIDSISKENGFAIVAPTGNEGNSRHHYHGFYDTDSTENTVELRVGDNTSGFVLEMWVNYPDKYSLEIITPLGSRIPASALYSNQTRRYNFPLETSEILIDYHSVDTLSGQQVIVIRFLTPTPGIWSIRVIGEIVVNKSYDMWLPIEEFISGDIYFLESTPDTTLTSPSDVKRVISVGGYNHENGSFYINSGRGYTTDGTIKPDIVAPVTAYGPITNTRNGYNYKTGTSISAAYTCGGAALLLEWGIINNNAPFMNSRDIKSYMIKGAGRSSNRTYPNPEYGYGELDMYNIFTTL